MCEKLTPIASFFTFTSSDVNDRQAVPVYRNSMQMGTNSGQNRHHQLQAQEVSPEDMEDTVAKVVEMEVRRVEQSWMTRLREEIKVSDPLERCGVAKDP